jgi:plastocyanin
MRTSRIVLALLALGILATACGSEFKGLRLEDAATAADHSFTIPAGAGEAYDQGEPLEILPGELSVVVGDVIEIINQDDRGHLVGPFFVGAGETLRQRFASPGEFVGICTVHPSGELVLVVSS